MAKSGKESELKIPAKFNTHVENSNHRKRKKIYM